MKRSSSRIAILAVVAALFATSAVVAADEAHELRIAVAANFKQTVESLCASYFATRRGRCVVSAGASGLLYAQIAQGAPYDLFLSADTERPERLEKDGLAVAGTRVTYAIGRLAYWRPGRPAAQDLPQALADPTLATLAIANPDTAPYGKAAIETLGSLHVPLEGRFKLVKGESIAQAFQFVASGAAAAGFVALSQVRERRSASGATIDGEVIVVDPSLHSPIEQQAVLLAPARDDAVARGFLDHLHGPEARKAIEEAGYFTLPE